jgi:hypothetical protein
LFIADRNLSARARVDLSRIGTTRRQGRGEQAADWALRVVMQAIPTAVSAIAMLFLGEFLLKHAARMLVDDR